MKNRRSSRSLHFALLGRDISGCDWRRPFQAMREQLAHFCRGALFRCGRSTSAGVSGLLLLAGRFVPLALALLAPVLVNILNYHITMDPGGIGAGLIATILWAIVFLQYRSSFAPIFHKQPAPPLA